MEGIIIIRMKMKKNDVVLVGVIVVIAMVALIMINVFVKKDGKVAVITVDGQVYATLELSKDTELEIQGIDGGMNKLKIYDGKAYMVEADCPDKVCINQGKISKTGETIVCLPHKVVIEIKGKDAEVDGLVQ